MNTKQSGIVHFLIFKDKKDQLYTGVALELDIVEQGEDPEQLRQSLVEAAKGHVETVISKNLGDDLLNRHAPSWYWKRMGKLLAEQAKLVEKRGKARQQHEPFLEIFTRKIKEGSRDLVPA